MWCVCVCVRISHTSSNACVHVCWVFFHHCVWGKWERREYCIRIAHVARFFLCILAGSSVFLSCLSFSFFFFSFSFFFSVLWLGAFVDDSFFFSSSMSVRKTHWFHFSDSRVSLAGIKQSFGLLSRRCPNPLSFRRSRRRIVIVCGVDGKVLLLFSFENWKSRLWSNSSSNDFSPKKTITNSFFSHWID